MDYTDLILQRMFQEVPIQDMDPDVKFESIVAALFGTRQRRNGPMPSPEVQVSVRDVVRESQQISILVPWGCSKQDKDQKFDILEFFALRQLACLRDQLRNYGKDVRYFVRVEDLTDQFLFGDGRLEDILDYGLAMRDLASVVLPEATILLESAVVSPALFLSCAKQYAPVFEKYLRGGSGISELQSQGWKGDIPQRQREYYYKAYANLYPGCDPVPELSKYFAASMARVKLRATCAPEVAHLQISFAKPVPGTPFAARRLYYRTLPNSCTHHHQAPWMGRGYFRICENNDVCPRFLTSVEERESTRWFSRP